MQLDPGKHTSKPFQHLTATFGKPAKPTTLNMWKCQALKDYLEHAAPPLDYEPEVFHTDIALKNILQSCVKWVFYTPEAAAVDGSFTVISGTIRRSDSTTNSSVVMYIMVIDNGSESCAVGEILFFVKVDILYDGRPYGDETMDEQKYYLAYFQQFLTKADGRFLYQFGLGLKVVIEARSILKLIGLIKNCNGQYIIQRHSCLFWYIYS